MKSWFFVPIFSTLLLVPARAGDLNARAQTVKSQLQTQWLPTWAKRTTTNESATDAAGTLLVLSKAHRLGYSVPDTNLLEAARAHYKLLRDSRRDKTNEGFVEQGANLGAASKATLLQGEVVLSLVEFARASGDAEPRGIAIKVWRLIRDRARDRINGGYYDSIVSATPTSTSATAFGSKSADTHLTLLEACTALYDLTHDRSIKNDLLELLDLNRGRFFPERVEESAATYTSNWEAVQPLTTPSAAQRDEAGAAIARAQQVLGMPIGWVEFVHRVDDAPTTTNAGAKLEALTVLAPITSTSESRASQVDAALDQITVGTLSPEDGIALLDFVQTFGK